MGKKSGGGKKGGRSKKGGSGGNGSGGGGHKVKGLAGGNSLKSAGSLRQETRALAKQEKRLARPNKRAQGGDDAIAETRQRLRSKIVQRQLHRLDASAPVHERRALMRELAQLHVDAGRRKQAIDTLKDAMRLDEDDPDFIRIHLLCLLMDQALAVDARALLLGPLFSKLVLAADTIDASAPIKPLPWTDRLATTAAAYSRALLTYLSVRVLHEFDDPLEVTRAEERLLTRLRAAHKWNPFCTEFIAFYPVFEEHFPEGLELPLVENCAPEEMFVREALEYCCHFGQVAVWLDSDEDVRRFIQRTIFEEENDHEAKGDSEEAPPFTPLPQPAGVKDPPLLARWRKARQDAMELWAEEMSVDGSRRSDDGNGEQDESEEESPIDSDEALARAEDEFA